MNRKEFIKKTGLAAAGAFVAPYILPSGRLFASTGGTALVDHVVLVMMAGGIRHQDSIQQLYLKGSQYSSYTGPSGDLPKLDIKGNVMYNLLEGQSPVYNKTVSTNNSDYNAAGKIFYGPSGSGDSHIDPIFQQGNTLQTQGIFYKKIKSSSPGHYTGLNVLLQGNTLLSQGLKQRPLYPTIFEYARKYRGLKATDTWFVGYGIGNSIPLLSYSQHPNWGAKYGANFLVPDVIFGNKKSLTTPLGEKYLKDAKIYHPDEYANLYGLKNFLDNTFEQVGVTYTDIGNTEQEKHDIKQFMQNMFGASYNNIRFPLIHNGSATVRDPQGNIIGGSYQSVDTTAVGYAIEVMDKFKPKLTVVNMHAVDGAHQNYPSYLQNLHVADHSVAHLWKYIQSTPGFQDNTIMIIVPECGRNLQPNAIKDINNLLGYDHSDLNTQDVFAMILGPQNSTAWTQGPSLGHMVDYSTSNNNQTADIVPTIAHAMGFLTDLQQEHQQNSFLYNTPVSLLSTQKLT
ncbi:MAG: hypothetical protein J0M08_03220 [Bacteroidetes bacterium]|nr:hypothetical protein [Bacteroidota bacterium]